MRLPKKYGQHEHASGLRFRQIGPIVCTALYLTAVMMLIGSRLAYSQPVPSLAAPVPAGSTLAESPLVSVSAPPPRDPLHHFMLNGKLGPSIEVWPTPYYSRTHDSAAYQLSLGIEGGFAISQASHLYVLLSLQHNFLGGSSFKSWQTLLIATGLQWDCAVPGARGLFVSSRLLLGYARPIEMIKPSHSEALVDSYDAGVVSPELGIKYLIPAATNRFHVGLDLVSIPIIFSQKNNSFVSPSDGLWIHYRMLLSFGVNL